jgi:hypothetical protein
MPEIQAPELTRVEERILVFESGWWRVPGAKEREILEVFGFPATRYYQLLNELINRPEATRFDPVLVDRLRRLRARRRRMRSARAGGVEMEGHPSVV